MNSAQFYPLLVSTIIIFVNLLIGLILFYRNWSFLKNALTTHGAVIALKRKGSTKSGRPMFSPVVEFIAEDGSRIEFTEFIARHPAGFQVGEQVTVFYDQRNFQRARVVRSKLDFYFPAWIFLLVGGVLLICLALVTIVFAVATAFLGAPGAKH